VTSIDGEPIAETRFLGSLTSFHAMPANGTVLSVTENSPQSREITYK